MSLYNVWSGNCNKFFIETSKGTSKVWLFFQVCEAHLEAAEVHLIQLPLDAQRWWKHEGQY